LHAKDRRSQRTGRKARLALAIAVAAGAVPAAASAAPGAVTSSGGIVAPGQPRVLDVVCVTRCVSGHRATPGAVVTVRGRSLSYVRSVVFRGPDGALRVPTTWRASRTVGARVPKQARSGRPYVVDFRGKLSNRSPRELEVVPPSAIPEQVFPVRGPHTYGDGWGAGRGHEGTDVLTACGTRLVAVTDGRIQYNAYQSAAGNYIVIDMKGTPDDVAYMHLIKPSMLRVGQAVQAGQTVGYVGQTGDATACHLHFEYWKGDWYGGGHPVDSEPFLRRLDRKS
jgi:murein DD-endopeptidase MepM/ murein hydrolase activator NlpD